jgi:hypothetical protein
MLAVYVNVHTCWHQHGKQKVSVSKGLRGSSHQHSHSPHFACCPISTYIHLALFAPHNRADSASGLQASAGSESLLEVARQAEGLSGRIMRKLPLLALAFFNTTPVGRSTTLERFLDALSAAIADRQQGREE